MLPLAERWADTAARWLAVVSGVLLLILAVAGVVDGALRYALSEPIAGTIEATELLLAVAIFAGLPYATSSDQHVVIDSFADGLPAGPRFGLRLLGAASLALVFAVISWQMASLAIDYYREGRTTLSARIPVVPFLLASLGAMCVATAVAVVRVLAMAGRGKERT